MDPSSYHGSPFSKIVSSRLDAFISVVSVSDTNSAALDMRKTWISLTTAAVLYPMPST
jgi:hypothetical protein